jgi:homogentisate 1,2-dioxygenase
MSRNNIEQGHITLHPKRIPHGPAPERHGKKHCHKETHELAVMVDTLDAYGNGRSDGIDDGEY